MDRSIPPAAAILLDFIRKTEVGRKDRASYDVIYGHKQHKLAKPLTSMTIGEIVDAQKSWSKNHGSSAAGGYQFMRATLIDLSKELHLRGDQVFNPDLQDRLGYHLLKRRGYESFMAGTISQEEFGKRLAQEWASLPVLAATRGATRMVGRGQSYYAGDGLNKALVDPVEFEMVLQVAKAAGNGHTVPFPSPGPQTPAEPKPAPVGRGGAIAALFAALAAAAYAAWDHITAFFAGVF